MNKKVWMIIIVVLVLIAAGVVALLSMGGSHAAIDNEPEAEVTGGSNILVAYFSWSGNTQQMASWVSEATGGDLFRIVPEEPYGADFDSTADRAQKELNSAARPAISTHIDTEVMAGYDVIYLGFPVWWYDLPTPVWTFLEEYDLTGKTIIPFFTHNGSSSGAGSLNRVEELTKGATVLADSALSIRGSSISGKEAQVKDWAVSAANAQ